MDGDRGAEDISSTFTGSGVVSSATTCPGRTITTFAFPVSTAAAERMYRCRAPSAPNHSFHTFASVV
ncbi:hypothetical protein [Streptomyces sp. G7(2002)]|uniref:hypothetical protein n=1 Tax=Streptomyces sp. G7(2002) TaxID=2971798 RepID=UPI00237DDDE5|nr:hypothetical protein [Streptomyces sp. G7(2002)]WDT54085.1 hypothetical protein NUT86_08480 [Streptomyces sp. G7(2002)]